jgi:hypothetical protein
LELNGFPREYQDLTIDRIENEAIGLKAVRENLGPDIADSVFISEPVVLVRAALPTGTFETGDASCRYFHGMQGKVTAKVRSERIIFTLVPGLKSAFDGFDE